jgi:hypothetical protein
MLQLARPKAACPAADKLPAANSVSIADKDIGGLAVNVIVLYLYIIQLTGFKNPVKLVNKMTV